MINLITPDRILSPSDIQCMIPYHIYFTHLNVHLKRRRKN